MPPTQRTHNTTHNCASSRFNQQNVWGFFFLLDFAAHFHIQLVAWRTLRLHREINCRDERRKSYTLRLRHQQQIIHDHYPVVATKTNGIRSLNYIFLLDISTQYTTKTNSRASEHTHTHPKSTSSRSTTNQTPNSESLHHAEPILEILKRNPVDKRCVPSPHLVFSTSLKQQKKRYSEHINPNKLHNMFYSSVTLCLFEMGLFLFHVILGTTHIVFPQVVGARVYIHFRCSSYLFIIILSI